MKPNSPSTGFGSSRCSISAERFVEIIASAVARKLRLFLRLSSSDRQFHLPKIVSHRVPRTKWILICNCYLVLALCLCAISSAALACPLDALENVYGSVHWNGIPVGATLSDVEKRTGQDLILVKNSDLPGYQVRTVVSGRPATLSFHSVQDRIQLTGMFFEKNRTDHNSCWSRENLLQVVRRQFPAARYVASRHGQNVAEVDAEYPTYVLDEANYVGVVLKPTHGTVILAELFRLE